MERFTIGEDNAVEDVGAILHDIRTQYDEVRCDSDMKEKELQRFRNLIKQADNANAVQQESVYKLDDTVLSLERQLEEGNLAIEEAIMNRKVYEHMLERLKKEQAILKQKQLKMEEHLKRKRSELADIEARKRAVIQDETATQEAVQKFRAELENERDVREQTLERIKGCVEAKNQSIKRRADFERWRHVVALDAANEAFNASAGRLRTMWALEKLAGNSLQKVIYEQVEKSQVTEDGFQKIREVTGLADVMDIVHKFLNRDVEQEQLKGAVAEAESKLESLQADHEQCKRDTEGVVAQDMQGSQRGIYQEVEDVSLQLQKKLKSYNAAKERGQKLTLAFEDVKRWSRRFNDSMRPQFDDEAPLETPQDIVKYFQGLVNVVTNFTSNTNKDHQSGSKKRMQLQKDEKAAEQILDHRKCPSNFRVNLSNQENQTKEQSAAERDLHEQEQEINMDRLKFKEDSQKRMVEEAKKQKNNRHRQK